MSKPTDNSATIDGKQVRVKAGWTILQAAQHAGIYIPTLCHLEALEPYGGCRLCLVEVTGMKGFPTSCTTPIEPGMEVLTRTPALQKLRSEILEFTLSEHPFTCLVCKDKRACTDYMHTTRKVGTITGCNFCTSNGDCELQDLVDYLELTDIKFPITYRGLPPVKDNPFYDLDYNLCILCGRCVRICNEERHSNVLAFVQRGNSTIVGTAFQESQLEAGCEYCGACVDVCPTGSISEKIGKWRGVPDRSVRTTCTVCPVACDMNVNTKNGTLVQIGPECGRRTAPAQLCIRGKFLASQIHDHPSRITRPLLKKDQKWVEMSWKDALNILAGKLESYRGKQFGLIGSGQDTLEDQYALQKFSRKVMHSNHVDLNTPYPSGQLPGQIHMFHAQHPPAGLAEIEKADTLLLIGMDASITHPLLENRIRKAFTAGKKVISAHPFATRTLNFTSEEVGYIPGEELNCLKAILKTVETGGKGSSLADSGRLVIIAGDSLLRHPQAEELAAILFRIHEIKNRRTKCHLLFPGHSSGFFGNMISGMHPDYLPGFMPVREKEVRLKWEELWGTRISSRRGWSCNEQVNKIGEEGIRAMMVAGDLPAHPKMGELEFLVQCNMFKTPLSEYADMLLPITDFLENEGHVISMELKVKKVRKTVPPPDSVKTIAEILSGLASAMDEKGFSGNPARLYREMNTLASLRNGKSKAGEPVQLSSGRRRIRMDPSFPVRTVIYPGPYRHRGNRLGELVPELDMIYPEGVVYLPDSMREKMKIDDGGKVRIVTEKGASEAVCRTMQGIPDSTACFVTNGEDSLKIMDGVYPEITTLFARIEKA